MVLELQVSQQPHIRMETTIYNRSLSLEGRNGVSGLTPYVVRRAVRRSLAGLFLDSLVQNGEWNACLISPISSSIPLVEPKLLCVRIRR